MQRLVPDSQWEDTPTSRLMQLLGDIAETSTENKVATRGASNAEQRTTMHTEVSGETQVPGTNREREGCTKLDLWAERQDYREYLRRERRDSYHSKGGVLQTTKTLYPIERIVVKDDEAENPAEVTDDQSTMLGVLTRKYSTKRKQEGWKA